MMRSVKPEVRILGIDDAPFSFGDERCSLIGTVFRSGLYMEGALVRDITVDGTDATDTIIDMVNASNHADQIQVVILDGVSVGGFNVCDGEMIAEETGKAVIAVSRTEPDLEKIRDALQNTENGEKRFETIKTWGAVKERENERGTLYFQHVNIEEEKARDVLKKSCTRSILPEPIRVAHMFGAALAHGESTSRP